jgi:DNA-binding transcriptional regulator GbsR (MarR family)
VNHIYGTLLYEDGSKRHYFIVECQYYSFYRWMFKHGWNQVAKEFYKLGNVEGFKVVLKMGGQICK